MMLQMLLVVLFFNVLTCYALTEIDIVQSIPEDRNLENDEESFEDNLEV